MISKIKKLNEFNRLNIYCITAEKFSMGRDNITVVKEMLQAGVRIIQYREKYKSFKEKYYECLKIRQMTLKNGAIFIINDHPDLCLMIGADGVHLGQDDYPVRVVRKLLGEKYIIGCLLYTS
ncbi:MAG: thiamine phosphate synthase, partial [Candidatus Goldbacteria bacterium]|nr:thiamine phosphate synthase [Candidatus Goldiibacteriota bacterium]